MNILWLMVLHLLLILNQKLDLNLKPVEMSKVSEYKFCIESRVNISPKIIVTMIKNNLRDNGVIDINDDDLTELAHEIYFSGYYLNNAVKQFKLLLEINPSVGILSLNHFDVYITQYTICLHLKRIILTQPLPKIYEAEEYCKNHKCEIIEANNVDYVARELYPYETEQIYSNLLSKKQIGIKMLS